MPDSAPAGRRRVPVASSHAREGGASGRVRAGPASKPDRVRYSWASSLPRPNEQESSTSGRLSQASGALRVVSTRDRSPRSRAGSGAERLSGDSEDWNRENQAFLCSFKTTSSGGFRGTVRQHLPRRVFVEVRHEELGVHRQTMVLEPGPITVSCVSRELRVEAVDENGRPIPGALVELYGLGPRNGEQALTGQTNSGGSTTFVKANGELLLCVGKIGYRAAQATIDGKVPVFEARLVRERVERIATVRVVDQNGRPCDKALIWARSVHGGREVDGGHSRRETTGADGGARLSLVQGLDYSIEVLWRRRFQKRRETIAAADTSPSVVVRVGSTAIVYVRPVLSEQAAGAVRGPLRFAWVSPGGEILQEGYNNGPITMRGVAKGEYVLYLADRGCGVVGEAVLSVDGTSPSVFVRVPLVESRVVRLEVRHGSFESATGQVKAWGVGAKLPRARERVGLGRRRHDDSRVLFQERSEARPGHYAVACGRLLGEARVEERRRSIGITLLRVRDRAVALSTPPAKPSASCPRSA